ncbi:MAG: NAD-dependent epimerase/dehydratase family protein [Polyangiales bacterium]
MKVMLTGATGFIGRRVVKALESEGHALTIAERTPGSFGRDVRGATPHRVVAVGEINRATEWGIALEGVEAVVHLAAHAHVVTPSPEDEIAFVETNVRGTDRLAERAVAAGVRRFVLMSSIGAVATSSDACITSSTPSRPTTPYGKSKLAAEEALLTQAHGSDMTWTILRPTLVYGPGNPGNMARLISLVRTGLPLPLGAIRNRRSFTFVDNLAALVAHALNHERAVNHVFLVADGDDVSTPELVRKIAVLHGRHAKLVPVPVSLLQRSAKVADVVSAATSRSLPFGTATIDRLAASLFVDTAGVRDVLGWSPPFDLDAGLRRMLVSP